MEQHDHPAYAKLQAIGAEITQKVKPKAVVVVRMLINMSLDTRLYRC